MKILTKNKIGVTSVFLTVSLLLPGLLLAQQSIYTSAEAISFYGNYDALWTPSTWKYNLNLWAEDLCKASYKAREVEQVYENRRQHHWLPGESRTGWDRSLMAPNSALFFLTATDLIPLRERSNIFAKASEPYEQALFDRIARSPPNSLLPADVMKLALEVTN